MQLELTSSEAERALARGVPLIGAGHLAVDAIEIAAELRQLAANLAETAALGSAAQRTAARLATLDVDVAALLGPALEGDRAELARQAATLEVDATALRDLVELAVQPALWDAGAQAASLTDLDRWDRGYCLLCGAWPAIAELVGAERRRVLRCVRCGSGWSWLVLLCPYCGSDDHRDLGALRADDAREEVATCQRCHGYVKGISTFNSHSAVRIVAEDVATVHLDVAATAAGYRRPGDVDASVAGIPRLARSAQA